MTYYPFSTNKKKVVKKFLIFLPLWWRRAWYLQSTKAVRTKWYYVQCRARDQAKTTYQLLTTFQGKYKRCGDSLLICNDCSYCKYVNSQSVLFRFLFAHYIRWPGMFYDCNDLHLFSFSRWKCNGWVTLHKLPNMYHWIVIMNQTCHSNYANGCATASLQPHTRFTLSHLVMATAATKPAKFTIECPL